MKKHSRYFFLVSDRILELKGELAAIDAKLSRMNKRDKKARKYMLEKEFILKKISYLEKLVNLPLYMAISNLSTEELNHICSRANIPAEKNYLIHLLGLDSIAANFGKPKVMTMAYLKDSFIDDYDFMTNLLDLQEKNFDLNSRKMALFSDGVLGFRSFQDLSNSLVKVNRYEERLNQDLNQTLIDYDTDNLLEIFNYIKNPETKLSHEFILKHVDKVSNLSPEMGKLCGSVKRKGILGFFSKFFNFKRSKKEKAFMDALVEAYKKDDYLNLIGLESIDFSTVKKAELKDLSKKVKRQISLKQEETLKSKSNILENQKKTLKEVQRCDAKKDGYFRQFASMLHSKHNFVPKMFEEQMWNEPDLKENLMREACYLEENELISRLSGSGTNVIDIQNVFDNTLEKDTEGPVRKLAA